MARTEQPSKELCIVPDSILQRDLATLLGITGQAIRKWVSAPRNADGSYSMPDVWDWWKRVPGNGQAVAGSSDEAAMIAMMAPEDRARLLKAKADHEEEKLQKPRMERMQMEGSLVALSELEQKLQRAAVPLRSVHTAMVRAGSPFAKEYEDALVEALAVIGVEEE